MICGFDIGYIIYCEACHFALSAFVGLLVWLLTSTILSHITFPTSNCGIRVHLSAVFIQRFSFCLALSFAVWSHILQDYTLGFF